jgi:hypothetical protein
MADSDKPNTCAVTRSLVFVMTWIPAVGFCVQQGKARARLGAHTRIHMERSTIEWDAKLYVSAIRRYENGCCGAQPGIWLRAPCAHAQPLLSDAACRAGVFRPTNARSQRRSWQLCGLRAPANLSAVQPYIRRSITRPRTGPRKWSLGPRPQGSGTTCEEAPRAAPKTEELIPLLAHSRHSDDTDVCLLLGVNRT